MKLWSRNAVLIAVQSFVLAAVTCGQVQPITITISTPQAQVKVGAPVLLHIVLKNRSSQDVYVFKAPGFGHAEQFYCISVSGIEKCAAHRAGSMIQKTLKPGEKLEEDTTISDFFDMKSTGIYRVIVKRPSPLNPDVILKSNEIKIAVTN